MPKFIKIVNASHDQLDIVRSDNIVSLRRYIDKHHIAIDSKGNQTPVEVFQVILTYGAMTISEKMFNKLEKELIK